MKLKTRIFWRVLPIMSNIWTLKAKARRHKKMPEYYRKHEKNHFLQKHLSNILKHLNIEVKVEGFDNVPNSSCFLTPNHSTYVDPLIIMSALYNHGDGSKVSKVANFVAKEEAKSNKTAALISTLCDVHYIDTSKPRDAWAVMSEFGKFVKSNKSCGVVFPEGTRTKDGKLGAFNSGVFRVAQAVFLPIVPVTILNAANALDKNRKGKLTVTVIFHPALKPIEFQTLDSKVLAEHVKGIVSSKYEDQEITSDETKKNKYTKAKKVKDKKDKKDDLDIFKEDITK
ncbi:1-acyl-sn-glycerol-3-phosphate acyltransferase [[Mycoplasma] falconis]|uniref:1-acyl-sn-glycerol-3-phosphate acyltransferase n=1 Tax=[Mycoplasma] falconis TaxID=92403 RepID=A0A501XC78_9BACT|nr:lysophospholipid acyltransferase family protein [[Mycoplasma] falconis]TPE58086.1 1-acyl-sn-glycerol-3-phosphate acyltransferase [[Mycoplasma] falconis]